MSRLMTNKYVAAVFVFLVFQWFAWSAFTGTELSDTERRRSKSNAVDGVILWLTDTIGRIPATAVFALGGIALGYVAYKRMERMARARGA